MDKSLLKSLLKSKLIENKSLDEMIDNIIKDYSKFNFNTLKKQLDDLYIFLYTNYKMEKQSFKYLVQSKIESLGIKDYEFDKEALGLKFKNKNNININFDNTDIKAMKLLDKSFYWLKNQYNTEFSDKIKIAVKDVMSGNLERKELFSRLKDDFNGIIRGSDTYFEGVADNLINQNRNLSTILDANEGIEYFKVMARMDGKTSKICRSMNGRLIPYRHLKNQADNILNAKNMAEKKSASTWSNEPFLNRSDKLPSNFGIPPYHFRCRTELVPVYTYSEDLGDGIKAKFTRKDDKDFLRHIDKTGVERVMSKTNTHIFDKHKEVSVKGIIKALNSIVQIAPNINNNYVNAFSDNGYFLVFNADEIVTAYKPKENKKDTFNYFKRVSKYDKKEVIKWQILGIWK